MNLNSFQFAVLVGALAFSTLGTGAPEKPVAVTIPGEPVEIRFPDGRVGQWMLTRKSPLKMEPPVQVFDNTCSDGLGMACTYVNYLAIDMSSFYWVKHPDPKKLNSMMLIRPKTLPENPPVGVGDFNFYSPVDRGKWPRILASMPNNVLICKDYSWLPSATVSAPPSLHLSRWDAEVMQTNPETGLMENRTLALAAHAHFKRDANGFLELVEVKRKLFEGFGFLIGDLWAFVVRHPARDFCQLSLKPNFGKLIADIISYFNKPGTPRPYLFAQDEYSDVRMPQMARELLKNPDAYDFL